MVWGDYELVDPDGHHIEYGNDTTGHKQETGRNNNHSSTYAHPQHGSGRTNTSSGDQFNSTDNRSGYDGRFGSNTFTNNSGSYGGSYERTSGQRPCFDDTSYDRRHREPSGFSSGSYERSSGNRPCFDGASYDKRHREPSGNGRGSYESIPRRDSIFDRENYRSGAFPSESARRSVFSSRRHHSSYDTDAYGGWADEEYLQDPHSRWR